MADVAQRVLEAVRQRLRLVLAVELVKRMLNLAKRADGKIKKKKGGSGDVPQQGSIHNKRLLTRRSWGTGAQAWR